MQAKVLKLVFEDSFEAEVSAQEVKQSLIKNLSYLVL